MMSNPSQACALAALSLSLAACGLDRPLLTREVLVNAAQKCGAADAKLIQPTKDGDIPSFSYLDPGPLPDGKPTPTSECLAKALEGYRFKSMTIQLTPSETGAP